MWAYPGRFLNNQTSCQIKNAANFQGIFQLWIGEIIFPLRSEPHDLIIFKQNEMRPVTHHTAATSRLKDWCNPPAGRRSSLPPSDSYLYLPDAVQDAAILEDPKQLVIGGDLVEIGSFLVREE